MHRVTADSESGETIVSGMGELHINVYLERIKREYNVRQSCGWDWLCNRNRSSFAMNLHCALQVDCNVGNPQVNYREAITRRAEFDYLHKKQSGGAGQFARVVGHLEPLDGDAEDNFEFVNELVGNALDPSFVQAVEKGFRQAMNAGALIGFPVQRMRVVLTDGQSHSVDSSEMAFRIAAMGAFKQSYERSQPVVLEPVMQVQVTAPGEYQGTIIANMNKRKGSVKGSKTEGEDSTVEAKVPLKEMFGYSTELRSMTQGKGEFTMEYCAHEAMMAHEQEELVKRFRGTTV